MPAASARTSPSATASLSPKISGVDRELHGRAAAERTEVEDRLRQGVEDGPGPFEVRGVAADHDRQLAALGEARRCPTPARRGSRRRPRGRPRSSPRMVDGGTVRRVDEDVAGAGAGDQAVGAAVDGLDGRAVGEHRDARRRPPRPRPRGGDAARPPSSAASGFGRRPASGSSRPARTRRGRALGPSRSPSGPCRAAPTAVIATSPRPAGDGSCRRSGRRSGSRGPRGPPPTAAGCAAW